MFHLIYLFTMLNLSFTPPEVSHEPCSSGFKNYREEMDSSGRSVLVEVDDPFEGLSADSFSLSAQIDAGVPLSHISSVDASGLSSIDRNNAAASEFVNSMSNSKKND